MRRQSLIALSLEEDPGNPLAMRLSDSVDAAAATRAHPADWRSWLLFADQNNHDLAASQKAAQLAPDNPTVLARLALAEQGAGRTADALLHGARAVELSPGRSDLLATYAVVLADSGRCAESQSYVQRSIDLLPDGAPGAALGALKSTRKAIGEHCRMLQTVQERKLGPPKRCDPPPRLGRKDVVEGPLVAEFVVRDDGSVADLTVKGKASERVLAALKRYVQSCKYEPVRQDGKALEIRWKVEFDAPKSR
jgi:tetratricopeptide (TPR) repeat protein